MSDAPTLAVIGGSGLYAMAGLTATEEHDLDTPFGKPSDPIVVGTLAGQRVASCRLRRARTSQRPRGTVCGP